MYRSDPSIVSAPPVRTAGAQRYVLHAVGEVTPAVFSFLQPVTQALADDGARQRVLFRADALQRAAITQAFDSRIELDRVHGQGAGWGVWLRRLDTILDRGEVTIVHAHGLTPAMLVLRAVRRRGASVRVYCSPHGSRWLGDREGVRLGGFFVRPLLRRLQHRVIANSELDARHLARAGRIEAPVLESPVASAYFEAAVAKAPRPVIAGGVYNDPGPSAVRFAQIAVLMGGGGAEVDFKWLGRVEGREAQRLRAARVAIVDEADPALRAHHVASAWLYLVPHAVHGYARHIAESLASGTPCIAVDTPHHRDLIRAGVTGFTYHDEAEMLEGIATLIDEPTIAVAMSTRAREVALERFGPQQFALRLLDCYREDGV